MHARRSSSATDTLCSVLLDTTVRREFCPQAASPQSQGNNLVCFHISDFSSGCSSESALDWECPCPDPEPHRDEVVWEGAQVWDIPNIHWDVPASSQIVMWHQFSSVVQSCPPLCDPMDCSTPGFPVLHHLPEFAQTRVHRVDDAIPLSHPL